MASTTTPAAGTRAQDGPDRPATAPPDAASTFMPRHLGPRESEMQKMLDAVGASSLDELIASTIPDDIRLDQPLKLDTPLSEHEALEALRQRAEQNQTYRSLIGMGYYGTITPPVIQRNVFENPLWYTPYTPYQPEISQGRLEALLNFQTMVADLTGMPVANASLLDEATAAAEAMVMCHGQARGKKPAFFVADDCYPQTLSVVRTRAESMGIELRVGPADQIDFAAADLSGILLQYPTRDGHVHNYDAIVEQARAAGASVVVASDLLALTLLRPPGEWAGGGADIVVGSAQRFGVPLGYGGPHAGFLATREKLVRKMPGRLVGVSRDEQGNNAFRLAIQTREQHIKRDKATSNICTAQVLLAVMAGMFGVWHGPAGLRAIASGVHSLTATLARGLGELGYDVPQQCYFDTITVRSSDAQAIHAAAAEHRINLRHVDEQTVGISLDELSTPAEVATLLEVFAGAAKREAPEAETLLAAGPDAIAGSAHERVSAYMSHEIFHRYRTETEMMRYIRRLQDRDISLAHSMIPLGSCTMKLNAAAEMMPVSWPAFAHLHPYCPADQARGYTQVFAELERWLAEMTGFSDVSLQPNAGSQGEYAGLLAIKQYHADRGQAQRDVCLIPTSAHGTNPASAVVAGLKVVPVQCDPQGNIDVEDLKAKAGQHAERLAALMVTYPSTHGVFEPTIRQVCRIVHEHGGQVYMDGANMNAQLGLTRPGDMGADVVHLNLHKTFCIPHGGGGPGMGPIAVAEHLAEHLPGDPLERDNAASGVRGRGGPVAAAPFGSPSIVLISWMYVAMMGTAGLTRATQIAVLNANYLAARLRGHYDVLYTGPNDRVAHEFILDCRPFQKSAGVTVDDIAKRMIDFGFHAPTMSFPVPGTLMIEPTESESLQELDRFCDAMIQIRDEIRQIETGQWDATDNPLKHAPHTAAMVCSDDWPHSYKREQAAYPVAWLRDAKYWPPVARIDQAWGDRNLVCSCPPMQEYCSM